MSFIQKLSSEDLLSKTEMLAREERRITVELIEHLREVDRRMLYAELGYGSLHEFCTKRLFMSGGSAQRRISAMFLMRDLPEVKEAILEGEVSLSNAAKLQVVFRAEKVQAKVESRAPLEIDAKRAIFEGVIGLSQRECESKLFEALPEVMRQEGSERERRIDENFTELRLLVPNEFLGKLQRLKELHSHAVPDGKVVEILMRAMDSEISLLKGKKGLAKDVQVKGASVLQREGGDVHTAAVQNETSQSDIPHPDILQSDILQSDLPQSDLPQSDIVEKASQKLRKRIPSFLQREVWKRAEGQCEYPGCTSRTRLEIDHRVPVALGGTNAFSNLRLLCRTHNQSEARRHFDSDFMQKFRG